MLNLAIGLGELALIVLSSEYLAISWKGCVRSLKEMHLTQGKALPLSKSIDESSSSPPTAPQATSIGYWVTSCTSNSRTLTDGESIAHWSAQPRATDSSPSQVLLTSFPKKAESSCCKIGIRMAPPTTSTAWSWSTVTPALLIASAQTFWKFAVIFSLHSASNSSRVTSPFTSVSFIKYSMAKKTFWLALRIRLTRSHSFHIFIIDFGFVVTSILYFSFT
mmetsp:Transcript_22584/g.31815  ORF Transcript_22584/g.31815 Transcript_22584/m.31815 type:complete len:220 (+) Transcript_22584:1360-2019(+)